MIEDARSKASLWRLGFGLASIVVVTFVWVIGVVWLAALRMDVPLSAAMTDVMRLEDQKPAGTALYLFLVVGMGVGTLLAARFWHGRGPVSLVGPGPRTLRHFMVAAGASWAAMAVFAAALLPFISSPVPNLDPWLWLVWFPLGLLVVAAQTGSEEVLFRGYLQSQIAARFSNPKVWMIVPALLFGALHFMPSLPILPALSVVLVAILFGILAADLTARTGSIGAAWGFHFANNTLTVLFVSGQESLGGLGLYRSTMSFSEQMTATPLIAIEILALTAIWALIRRLLSV
ncbi:MAG: CPBP family intramembrane metalloprotease [Silicimonas sp.]|nr:CPBP family intramembrane metalloprotease [Silicimonas sp.]